MIFADMIFADIISADSAGTTALDPSTGWLSMLTDWLSSLAGVLPILSGILLVAGGLFSIVGGIGIVRLPEFYSRLHGGGITDTAGAAMILTGLMLIAGSILVAVKLGMILFFLFIASPSSSHALAKSALFWGIRPVLERGQTTYDQNAPDAPGGQRGRVGT